MLSQRQLTRLRAQRSALVEELRRTPNLMRGIVYERQRKCGRRSCPCARGGPRHNNVLSALKSLALPPHLSTARPKRLRFALFTLAGRLLTHAGQLWLRVSAAAERLAGLIAARQRLALLAQGLPAG